MLKGNRGEWSEVYALFRILANGSIDAGDGNLEVVPGDALQVLKVFRSESSLVITFEIVGSSIFVISDTTTATVSVTDFTLNADALLEEIKSQKGASFSFSQAENFLKTLFCYTLKAKSSLKSDVELETYNKKIHKAVRQGFSIKSKLGGDSTLLNAGKPTNFKYKIVGDSFSAADMRSINSISGSSKLKKRVEGITSKDAKIVFDGLEHSMFDCNLQLIDSSMPRLLAEMVLDYYSSKRRTIKDLLKQISSSNPLGFPSMHAHNYYTYKIKRLLTDISLGMMPASKWDGLLDATGGFLVVRDDGKLLYYHLYDRNHFEDYLIANTYFDTASTTKYDFGSVYEENGSFYIKLNLQIRFS